MRSEPPVHLSRHSRYRATRVATLTAAATNTLLGATQIVTGFLFQSQALIADGVHTVSDLVSDGVVFFAARQASASPDRDYPYGYGRLETLATVIVGLLLTLAAVGIGWTAIQRLLAWQTLSGPTAPALAFAALTLVAKEALYQYTVRVARRIDSPMLKANAWHHRTDAISSLVVLIGVGGAVAGWPWLDAVAALVVAVFIVRVAWRLMFESATELIDTALEPQQVDEIRRTIMNVPGVRSVHMLRTRRLGNEAAADVHIQVAPRISVSEGHQIADEVYGAVMGNMPILRDVTVHVDPEDDEQEPLSRGLPLRPEVASRIRDAWRAEPELDAIEQIDLHYLGGRLHLTVTLRLDQTAESADLDRRAGELARLVHQGLGLNERLGEVVIQYRATDAQSARS